MKIALMSDTHLAGIAVAFNQNCAAALQWLEAAGAELVVHLGDVSADGVTRHAQLMEARAIFDASPVPMRYLPGNHDVGDNPLPGYTGNEPSVSADALARYRAVFGADYWAIDAAGWRLIGLDAQLFGSGDAEEAGQIAWLAQTLQSATGPVGVLLHKPLFRHGPADRDIHPRYAPWAVRAQLLELFAGKDLRFVASGHVHQWRRHVVDGVEHLWVPSCGFVMPDLLQAVIGEKVVGVVMLDLSDDAMSITLVTPPEVQRYDLANFAEVYPALPGILAALREKTKAD